MLVDGDAVGGVSQRGGAPGTRETDLLDPLNMVDKVNAVVLSGGSAFGLDAATGVVRWLEERGIGWPTAGRARVPIVTGAILFDLGVGSNPKIRPAADCGYRAAQGATERAVAEGSVGAGAGATVGKFGGGRSMKAGIGIRRHRAAERAHRRSHRRGECRRRHHRSGDRDGRRRRPRPGRKARRCPRRFFGPARRSSRPPAGENTTIGVVATNARLTKAQANRVALMADDGYARAIYPSHTEGDGDTIFALATGRWDGTASVTTIGALAADVMAAGRRPRRHAGDGASRHPSG